MSNLSDLFKQRTENINAIFSSYRTLYDIYITALRTVKANGNTLTALENAKASVDKEQGRISNQLYSQGFILLVGAAEALLKDIFDTLLIENFTEFNAPNSLNFSAKDVQTLVSRLDKAKGIRELNKSLGTLAKNKIHNTKNPTEKINLQNVQSMRDLFKSYFGIEISESDNTKLIHRYWQVRHSLIHSGGVIDERFIHNVDVVNLLKKTEKIGASLTVTKTDYSKAEKVFYELFEEIDQLLTVAGLSYNSLK